MSSPAAPTSPPVATVPVTTPEQPTDTAATTTRDTLTSTSDTATSPPATTAAPSTSSNPVVSSPTSSASSSATTSSTSSAAPPSTTSAAKTTSAPTSSSAPKTSLTSSLSFVVQTSDGQVFTQTSVITLPLSTPTQSSTSQSSTSFFHNTGAVAGVFSVVGVIALVVIFFLLTSFIRRRRARKLDREIDEAAAAAANAHLPDFDDFDYTSGTGVGYGGQYSETSHGTYNQPPLSHERSRNNLGDIPPSFDSYNGTGGAGSGAAGIGARGRSVRGGGVPDPFGALANPPEQYEMNETRRSWHQGSVRGGTEVTTYDLLQAAGLAGSDPYAVTRGASTRLAHNPSQSGMSALTRSQSQGASSLLTSAESYPMPTPAPAYPGGQDRPYPSEKARYSASYAPGGGFPTMPSGGDADVYGGYQDQPSAQFDNPHSPGLGPRAHEDEHEEVPEQYEPPYSHGPEEPARASLADDEDYGYNIGHRVLRVANE